MSEQNNLMKTIQENKLVTAIIIVILIFLIFWMANGTMMQRRDNYLVYRSYGPESYVTAEGPWVKKYLVGNR